MSGRQGHNAARPGSGEVGFQRREGGGPEVVLDDEQELWCGIRMEFPNGTPDRFVAGDDSCWFAGYIVDVEDVDGQVVSFSVAGERLGDDGVELFGHHFNELSGRPTDVEVSFPIDRIRMIVVP